MRGTVQVRLALPSPAAVTHRLRNAGGRGDACQRGVRVEIAAADRVGRPVGRDRAAVLCRVVITSAGVSAGSLSISSAPIAAACGAAAEVP